jgi:hypothetical protein
MLEDVATCWQKYVQGPHCQAHAIADLPFIGNKISICSLEILIDLQSRIPA